MEDIKRDNQLKTDEQRQIMEGQNQTEQNEMEKDQAKKSMTGDKKEWSLM